MGRLYMGRLCRNLGFRLPFKAQYDPSRVPIITPPSAPTGRYAEDDIDSRTTGHPRRHSRGNREGSPVHRGSMQRAAANSLFNHLESLDSLGTILKDAIVHSSSAEELMTNEMAREVVDSLRSMQMQLAGSMEQYIETHPEQIERIFQLNELAQNNIQCYDDITSGNLDLSTAKSQIAPDMSNDGSTDLLDVGGDDLLGNNTAPVSTGTSNVNSLKGNMDLFGASSSSSTANSSVLDAFGNSDVFNNPAAASTAPTSSSSTNVGSNSKVFDALSSMASKPDDDWTSAPSTSAADIFSSSVPIAPITMPTKNDISSQIDNLYAEKQQQLPPPQISMQQPPSFPSATPQQQPFATNQYNQQQQFVSMAQMPSGFPSSMGIQSEPMTQPNTMNQHHQQQVMQPEQQSNPKDSNPFDMF